MSIRPKVGGMVQIGGKSYKVISPPIRCSPAFRMNVEDEDGNSLSVWSDGWRTGHGPWRKDAPPTRTSTLESAPVFKAAQNSAESDLVVTPGCAGADTPSVTSKGG